MSEQDKHSYSAESDLEKQRTSTDSYNYQHLVHNKRTNRPEWVVTEPGAVIPISAGTGLSMASTYYLSNPGYEEEMRKQRAKRIELAREAEEAKLKQQLEAEQQTKERMKKVEQSLVAPGEITDAADSSDLLAQLAELNGEKILSKKEASWKRKQVQEEERARKKEFYNLAEKHYKQMWNQCNELDGHSYHGVDIQGSTMQVCEVCGYPKPPGGDAGGWEYRVFDDYKNKLIKTLQLRMMEIDKEVGLLDDIKEEDFVFDPSLLKPPPKPYYKNRFAWRGKIFPGWRKVKVVPSV